MAVGVIRYGLTEDHFWGLTPAQFVAYTEQVEEEEKVQDFRFGTVAAIIANVNRDPKRRSQAYQPADFFGSLKGGSKGNTFDEDPDGFVDHMDRWIRNQ